MTSTSPGIHEALASFLRACEMDKRTPTAANSRYCELRNSPYSHKSFTGRLPVLGQVLVVRDHAGKSKIKVFGF